MKSKGLVSLLFSTVGIAIMLVIVIAVCIIANSCKVRHDFTEDHLYTLSQGTKNILKSLDAPVELRFYCSQGGSKAAQIFIRTYSKNVDDLLNEYAKHSEGKLKVKRYNPEPDSDAEDMAKADGIYGQTIETGDVIYLGLAISSLDRTVPIPFLSPARERLMEYDISRAIAEISAPTKTKIGVVTDLPVFGMPMNPMMMQQQQQMNNQPWTFVTELKKEFDVVEISPAELETVDPEINTLMVIYPKNFSDKALYALDQFVLRGGRMMVYVDPVFAMDPNARNAQNPMARMETSANMEKLFDAWGIKFDSTRVVVDRNYPTVIGRGGQSEEFLSILSLTSEAFSTNNIAMLQVDSALMAFAGCFEGTPTEGLKKDVLIKSSEDAQLVDRLMAEMNSEIAKSYQPAHKEYALSIMLSGKFKTAFPDGAPATEEVKDEKSESETPAPAKAPQLKESTGEGAVILFGDTDMLHDGFSVRISNIFGQRIVSPINGNLVLAQNFAEQLAGNINLISMRSRATMNRPFTRIQQYKAKAEAEYQSQLMELENRLNEARRNISELQKAKTDGSQTYILSDEQRAELVKYRKSEAETQKTLKEVRKKLRKDINSLEDSLKWINIAAMPVVIILIGIIIAVIKRKRNAAR